MITQFAPFAQTAQRVLQWVTMGVFSLAAVGLTASSALAALEVLPWLTMPLSFGPTTFENAGMAVQLGVTALAAGLLFFLPSAVRVMRLEQSHRNFRASMEDVTRAYHVAHTGDRQGLFTVSSEFDSVRERLAYLNQHPDLAELEPQILELAAQMSHVSRDLAETYSDENVERARTFLKQRQQEITRMEERISVARTTGGELKRWMTQVSLDEDVQKLQVAQLTKDIAEIMPEILMSPDTKKQGVVPLYNTQRTTRVS